MSNFSVHILGSGAAVPSLERSCSGQLVICNNRHILIDCGEGTQLQLRKFNLPIQRINTILISHLHGDHFYGLPGLLGTMSLLGRTTGIEIFGPADLGDILAVIFKGSQTKLDFPFTFHPIAPTARTTIFEDAGLCIYAFPLKHRIPCYGYAVQEKHQRFRLDIDKVEEAGFSHDHRKLLSEGVDFQRMDGTWIKYQDYTLAKPEVKMYAYCSDTMPFKKLTEYLDGTTTLYHESTFMEDRKQRANETFHSTASDAANQAVKSKVKQLLLGHFSSRYSQIDGLLAEASNLFQNTRAVRDGDQFEIL